MLDTVKEEFENRSNEIDILYAHLASLTPKEGSANDELDGLACILSSSLCLMIYNQIESTAYSCVEAIYDALEENNISFNSLVPTFKQKILEDCRESYHSGKSLVKRLNGGGIAEALAKASLNLERVFNGNVDAKRIREIMALYNLCITPPSLANEGAELLNIKLARQALAHGNTSFQNYGRKITLEELNTRRNNAREYMSHIIELTAHYLTEKLYLANPSAA